MLRNYHKAHYHYLTKYKHQIQIDSHKDANMNQISSKSVQRFEGGCLKCVLDVYLDFNTFCRGPPKL